MPRLLDKTAAVTGAGSGIGRAVDDHEKTTRRAEPSSKMLLCSSDVDPAQVAELILCLASDASSFSTGGMYMIDGGMQYCLQH